MNLPRPAGSALREEMLAKLVEAVPFAQMVELARKCMALRGFHAPVATDGWNDGGTDVRVYNPEGNTAVRIAVQVSVLRKWKPKLLADLGRAISQLKVHSFIYVSSRRIPEADFHKVADDILSKQGVAVQRMDKFGIASLLLDRDEVQWFLDFCGVGDVRANPVGGSLRTTVADSFMLFSTDVTNFRDQIAEHAIACALMEKEPLAEDDLIARAADALGAAGPVGEGLCRSATSRLIQRKTLLASAAGTLTLDARVRRERTESNRLVESQWLVLIGDLKNRLGPLLVPSASVDEAADRVAKQLGRLVIAYREYQAALLNRVRDDAARKRIVTEAVAAETILREAGIRAGKEKECSELLADMEQQHPVLSRLTAGEVFRRAVTLKERDVVAALGGSGELRVVVESSVMITLFCTLMYRQLSDAGDKGAYQLYKNARDLGKPVYLPSVYLEECASHLIEAANYAPVISSTSLQELRHSENAYVSFFARLPDNRRPQFPAFLRAFGHSQETREFTRLRIAIQGRLLSIGRQYGLDVWHIDPRRLDAELKRLTEIDLDRLYDKLWKRKPRILVDHDTWLVSYLRDPSLVGSEYPLLCTWDNTLIELSTSDDHDWWCLDPIHASDLLGLALPRDVSSTLGLQVVFQMTDSQLVAAARIWDTLVEFERGKLMDAALFEEARRFKDTYRKQQKPDSIRARQIIDSWERWKSGSAANPGRS